MLTILVRNLQRLKCDPHPLYERAKATPKERDVLIILVRLDGLQGFAGALRVVQPFRVCHFQLCGRVKIRRYDGDKQDDGRMEGSAAN